MRKVTRYWKGKELSDEHRLKLSISHMGNKQPDEIKRKISEKLKNRPELTALKIGRKVGLETRKKLSKCLLGNKHGLGTKRTLEQKIRMKDRQPGEKHWNWKGGITPESERLRHSLEYKLWRISVFERDNYTCVWCKKRGGILNADHIEEWAKKPELRFEISNGRTLCVACHKQRTWGGLGVINYGN